jgi:hypothetical protein
LKIVRMIVLCEVVHLPFNLRVKLKREKRLA